MLKTLKIPAMPLLRNPVEGIIAATPRSFDSYPPLDVGDFFDGAPARTAESTERMAEAVAELVALTANSLALSEKQREQSERSERFSRRMTWVSVILTGASFVAAVVAIIVTR